MNQTARNLIIAIVLGVVGIVLMGSYLNRQKAKIVKGQEQVKVLVAKKDIPAGTSASKLDEGGYVETAEVNRDSLPPQALSKLSDVKKLSVNVPIYAGDYITRTKFERAAGLNPTDQISGTKRLISIPISPAGSVARMIKPGDRVDILASGDVKRMDGTEEVEDVTTWWAAKNVVVRQTPESMQPEGAETEPVEVKDDDGIYVLEVTDEVAQDLYFSLAKADKPGLIMVLRPGSGDEEEAAGPLFSIPEN